MALFRCGTAPINIELGRYIGVPADQRFCIYCVNSVEDEIHVILNCPLYSSVRRDLFTLAAYHNPAFVNLSDDDKIIYVFTECNLVSKCAKTCKIILDKRNQQVYRF